MFWVWGSGFRVWIEFTLHLLVSKEGEESNVGADVENVALASLPMQGLEFRIYCLGFGVDGFEGGGVPHLPAPAMWPAWCTPDAQKSPAIRGLKANTAGLRLKN